MTEGIGHDLEAVHGDQCRRDGVIRAASHLAQRAIELIEEVVPIRQPGEGIVIVRMIEAALQPLAQFHFLRQPRLRALQPPSRHRQRGAQLL